MHNRVYLLAVIGTPMHIRDDCSVVIDNKWGCKGVCSRPSSSIVRQFSILVPFMILFPPCTIFCGVLAGITKHTEVMG